MSSWNPKEIAKRDQSAANEMTAYGITCVSVPSFHYKSFRYSNLEDAIAQAKRDSLGKVHPDGAYLRASRPIED